MATNHLTTHASELPPLKKTFNKQDIERQRHEIEEGRQQLGRSRLSVLEAGRALKRAEESYVEQHRIACVAAELALMKAQTIADLCGSCDVSTMHSFQNDAIDLYQTIARDGVRFDDSVAFVNSRYGQYLSYVYRNKLFRT